MEISINVQIPMVERSNLNKVHRSGFRRGAPVYLNHHKLMNFVIHHIISYHIKYIEYNLAFCTTIRYRSVLGLLKNLNKGLL